MQELGLGAATALDIAAAAAATGSLLYGGNYCCPATAAAQLARLLDVPAEH